MPVYLEEVAAHVEFPDTTFVVVQIADPDAIDKVMLCAELCGPDNFNVDESFKVRRCRQVPAYYNTEREALEEIRKLMHYLACHEVDEKLHFKGVPIHNPHGTWDRAQFP